MVNYFFFPFEGKEIDGRIYKRRKSEVSFLNSTIYPTLFLI